MIFNPSYVFRSRHGIFYARYPIPVDHHPYGKRDCIKLSLKTYVKKEALDLASVLRYFDSEMMERFYSMYGGLTYKEYKEKLTSLFREALERRKQVLDNKGFVTDEDSTFNPDWFYQNSEGEVYNYLLTEDTYKNLCERTDLPYIPEGDEGRDKINQLVNALCLELYKGLREHNTLLKSPSLTQPQVMQVNITDTSSLGYPCLGIDIKHKGNISTSYNIPNCYCLDDVKRIYNKDIYKRYINLNS